LLNNDVEALEAGWLDAMVDRMTESDVGAVGATLLWPSRIVQHAGVVLGMNFAAVHAFNERINGDPGYADLLNVSHECSAVTGACLLTRRRLLIDCGGLDGVHFPVNFNDVDFCLKLRASGLRIIVTPDAKLLHRESASRGSEGSPDERKRREWEVEHLRSVWGEALMNDPYYSPMLGLDGAPFSALAWPPRSRDPRQPLAISARPIPPGY
jgi:O-antigen biosynthesis protein